MPLLDFHVSAGNDNHGTTGTGVRYEGGITENMSVLDNPLIRRPYIPDRGPNAGYPCVSVHNGRYTTEKGERKRILQQERIVNLMNRGIVDPIFITANATSLRKEQWIELDKRVIMAARQRLRFYSDLKAANPFGGFNGMGKLTLEYEAMSDPGSAIVDMDGISEAQGDTPLFKLRSLPLPITHSDFWYSERRLQISRGSGTPLDTISAECAGRRIGETIEQTSIGTETGITYGTQSTGTTAHDGNSTVFGLTNFTPRNTKTNMTVPTGSNPEVTVSDVLAMRNTLYGDKFYGPYTIYHSTDWDTYLDNDYARLGGNNANMTLRDRLRAIDGINDVKRLDYLTSTFTMIMVQMTSDVCRAVTGMELTTVQWPSVGGMRTNFKVMCIEVPQLFSDYSGNCGILHGTTV